jgi:predicted permease
MTTLWQDVRYGFRQLRKSPGFTVIAVLSLALGIGVNTAIFSLINGILYKSLPVRNAHELRQISWTCDAKSERPDLTGGLEGGLSHRLSGGFCCCSFPYPVYQDFAIHAQGFSDIFAISYEAQRVTINAGGVPASAHARMVSGNFFKGYGAPVLIGRPITPEDDHPDAPPVAVLTYPLWQRAFGLDPHAIGRTLRVGQTGFTVIGVLPRRYLGPLAGQRHADFYVPMMTQSLIMGEEDGRLSRYDGWWWIHIMGRLVPGADEAQMQASLELVFSQVLSRSQVKMGRPGILVQKARHGVVDERHAWIAGGFAMQAVVGLVLLIACTNLAGLLLARGATRQHELAVRAALGAGRWHLIRQSLTESMILSLAGVCLGLLLSVWIRAAVSGFIFDPSNDRHFDLTIDANVLMFALAVGVVATLLSGLLPAWRAGKTDPSAGLKDSGSRGAPRLRLGKVLVAAQVSMSILFVILGGLLSRTLINLNRVDPGYDTENLLLVPIDPEKSLSPPRNEQRFFDAVRQKIARIHGVRSVAFSDTTLTGGLGWSPDIEIPGHPDDRDREARMLSVSEGYFATVGINLLQGRDFLATDTERVQDVVIINEEFARVFFPDENPLGRYMAIKGWEGEYQIVGLCGNQMCRDLRKGIMPIFYRPHTQYEISRMICMIRSVLPPMSLIPAVRKAVADVDRNLPLEGIITQKLAIKESLRLERLMTSLFGSFALLALALSCIGLYGLMAYNVARRTGEMGIRKALGARPWDVARPILLEALILTAIGIIIGLPVSLALVRLGRWFFYGIEPHDPLTMIGTVVIMVTVAALAAWIPARRAAKIDPMEALRYE